MTITLNQATACWLSLQIAPEYIPVDGETTATVTATLKRQDGEPAGGYIVSFSKEGSGILAPESPTTNASGQATTTYYQPTTPTPSIVVIKAGVTINVDGTNKTFTAYGKVYLVGVKSIQANPDIARYNKYDNYAISYNIITEPPGHGNMVSVDERNLHKTFYGDHGTITATLGSSSATCKVYVCMNKDQISEYASKIGNLEQAYKEVTAVNEDIEGKEELLATQHDLKEEREEKIKELQGDLHRLNSKINIIFTTLNRASDIQTAIDMLAIAKTGGLWLLIKTTLGGVLQTLSLNQLEAYVKNYYKSDLEDLQKKLQQKKDSLKGIKLLIKKIEKELSALKKKRSKILSGVGTNDLEVIKATIWASKCHVNKNNHPYEDPDYSDVDCW